jgi:hypothetical protein
VSGEYVKDFNGHGFSGTTAGEGGVPHPALVTAPGIVGVRVRRRRRPLRLPRLAPGRGRLLLLGLLSGLVVRFPQPGFPLAQPVGEGIVLGRAVEQPEVEDARGVDPRRLVFGPDGQVRDELASRVALRRRGLGLGRRLLPGPPIFLVAGGAGSGSPKKGERDLSGERLEEKGGLILSLLVVSGGLS